MRWPHAVVVNEGRIYVSDAGNSRIMVWNGSPNANGAPCSFVLGQGDFGGIDHNAARLSPTERSLQMPYGLVMHGGTLICADTANSRLMGFAREGLGMGARAVGLAAQRGFGAKGDNRWQVATRDSVCWPFAVTSSGDLVVVADTGNNRVLLWEAA